jgi:hypothetical protein
MRFARLAHNCTDDPAADVVAGLWQTKLRSVRLLEGWLPQASDFGILAGLQAHLGEERRHQRILGMEVGRREGWWAAGSVGHMLDAPFEIVRAQTDDLERVRLFHHGIKAPTARYCERALALVDPALAQVLERIARDDRRHIRWAEIRLAHEPFAREPDPLLAAIEAAVDAVWSRPLRRLSLAG